jgi:hypothetical protein
MVACDRHSKRQGRARVHGVAPERYARAESNVVHAGRFRTSRTPLNRCAIDEVNHWSASPAVLDRAVPDHRSLMPFQNTRHSCIPSTHDSHRRLQALNGYRTELQPDCSFRNRLVGENPPPIKKTSCRKGNRANTAYGRPNPTRNFKKLAHYRPPLVYYLHALRDPRTTPLIVLRRTLPRHKQPAWPDVI